MTAQGVLALGAILSVLLLLIMSPRREMASSSDPFAEARDLIGEEIDAHVDALAQGYLEAGSGRAEDRPGTDRFSREVELFIAEVLERRAEQSDAWLRDALREIVVLERDGVYAEVRQRVEAHLRRTHHPLEEPAEPSESSSGI